MELQTHLSQDRFFWMKDEVTDADAAHLLVEAVAPPLVVGRGGSDATLETTASTNLVVVLDRSGSMAGGRLDHAKRALCDVIDRLSPTDNFGLVIFDDEVETVVRAGPVTNNTAIKRTINGVQAGGSTDLGSGLIRGLQEARRLKSESGVRVLLISDGHANQGITDPVKLGEFVGGHLDRRITTSSLGMGLGYDETLLSAIAQAGGGNEHFAEEADTAAAIIGEECGDLISQRYLSARLTITTATGMNRVTVLNEATQHQTPDGVVVELGGFRPDQARSLVLRFDPRPTTRPGRRKVAMLRLDYVLADDLSEHSVSTSVWARVARLGERPAVVNPDVVAEVVFQEVQRRKRKAMRALSIGDLDRANHIFDATVRFIRQNLNRVPRARRDEFRQELDLIDTMRRRVHHDVQILGQAEGGNWSAKAMSADLLNKSRFHDRGSA